MSNPETYVAWIWDLDRDDAHMHLRTFVKALKDANAPKKNMGDRRNGRYCILLPVRGQSVFGSVRDAATLGTSMHEMLLPPSKFDRGSSICVVGLPDTVQVLEAIVAEWRAASDLLIELHAEPLPPTESPP